LSLARFGYSVLLPAMRSDLHWSYTQAGAMNTANAAGYLVGALAAGLVLAKVPEHRAFRAAFLICGASILLSALTANFAVLLILRAIGGGASAVLFVSGATLAARLADVTPTPGLVLGLYFAGVGPGILVSAALAPVVLSTDGGWRIGWAVMGALALVGAIPAARVARLFEGPNDDAPRAPRRLAELRWSLGAFTLYGFGYVSFMTFIVARYRETGASALDVTIFWSVLGIAAIGSGWIWRPLLDREGGSALPILLSLCTLGAIVPLLGSGPSFMLASAIVFGGTFLGVTAALTQLVRRSLPQPAWGFGLVVATALFAGGQTLGPLLTGLLADRTGDLSTGLLVSAAFLASAAMAATQQGSRAS
jgi:predicted MFS family arabinose efflux permease